MPGDCCHHCDEPPRESSAQYRKLLWIALVINGAMFAVELASSFRGESVSLLADSLDFLGDAANYGISLAVLGMTLDVRVKASRLKAASMLAFGVWVLALAVWHFTTDRIPNVPIMGAVGSCALLANGTVAALLYRFREGDSNMRSVWLCTRNDALGNLAVLLAALGVFGTGSAWPDLIVAATMSFLAVTSALRIIRPSNEELRGYQQSRSTAQN